MNKGLWSKVDDKRLRKVLKMYQDIFEVVDCPSSDGHPNITIYYKNREYVKNSLIIVDIHTKVSFNKRIFVMDTQAESVTCNAMSLCLKKCEGMIYISDVEKVVLSDEFCLTLSKYDITIENCHVGTNIPLYDMNAIRRRKTIKDILNE